MTTDLLGQLFAGMRRVYSGGFLTARSTLEAGAGLVATDDATNRRTVLSIDFNEIPGASAIEDVVGRVSFTTPNATPVVTALLTPAATGGLNSCAGHARIVAVATRGNGTIVTIELLATWKKLSGTLTITETSQLHPSPDLDATAEVVASGGTSIAIQTTGPAVALAWDVRIELYQKSFTYTPS